MKNPISAFFSSAMVKHTDAVAEYTIDNIANSNLSADKKRWATDIFSLFWDLHSLTTSLQEGGEFPRTKGKFSPNCKGSLLVKNCNYIVLDDDGEEIILFQGNSSLGWIYFKRQNLVIKKLKSAAAPEISRFIDFYNGEAANIFSSSDAAFFKGYSLGYDRPYHYFYDHLSGLYEAMRSSAANLVDKNFFTVSGSNFLPVAEVFGINITEFFSETELNNNIIACRGFLVRIVRAANQSYDNYNFRRFLLSHPAVQNNLDVHRDVKYKIWFGLCSEKRSWYQYRDAIVEVAKFFKRRNEKVLFVFDGITLPSNFSEGMFNEPALKENNILESLREDLPDNICIKSMIKTTALEKIKSAADVDFFFCNRATDSMYPAKISCKPGIAFGANAMPIGGHTHIRTTMVPKDWVKDVSHGDDITKISFHIDPQKVLGLFLETFARAVENRMHIKPYLSCEGLFFLRWENNGFVYKAECRDQYALIAFQKDYILSRLGKESIPLRMGEYYTLHFKCEYEASLDVKFIYFVRRIDGVEERRFARPSGYIDLFGNDYSLIYGFKVAVKGAGDFCFYDIELVRVGQE